MRVASMRRIRPWYASSAKKQIKSSPIPSLKQVEIK
jgi:hypothetical protein